MKDGRKDFSKIKDKRVVLLQSGGLDSCFLARFFQWRDFEVHHVYIDYGQNARLKELTCASSIVDAYGGEFHLVEIDLPWLRESSNLTGREDGKVGMGEIDTSGGFGALNTVKAGIYVPMRNFMFLSIASSLAESLGIPYIASGLDGTQDWLGRPTSGTPDKHKNFVKKLEKTITESSALYHINGVKSELLVPILGNRKVDTIHQGNQIDCDFSLSWSCYSDNWYYPCGKCGSCIEREASFEALGLVDPLVELRSRFK